MAVRLNEDKEMVARIREGLKKRGGYCPCRIEKTEDNKEAILKNPISNIVHDTKNDTE